MKIKATEVVNSKSKVAFEKEELKVRDGSINLSRAPIARRIVSELFSCRDRTIPTRELIRRVYSDRMPESPSRQMFSSLRKSLIKNISRLRVEMRKQNEGDLPKNLFLHFNRSTRGWELIKAEQKKNL